MAVRALAGLIALLVVFGCGDGRPQASAPAATAPANPIESSERLPRATRGYIVISLDTLRADHLGCYGYPRPTSPFLDSLAARATLFEEAYAQYPSTLVSHMSMFTGLHPREHGVLFSHAALSPAIEMFPEVFQRSGFRTAAFTEGGFVSGRYGFRRGFDEFVARNRDRNRPLEGTFRRGVRFLESLGSDDRFLLFLHTYAIHTPYDAPERFRREFWTGPAPPGAIAPTGPAFTRHNATGSRLSEPVIAWLAAHYDAGIRETDDVLRRFFADLERLGLADAVTVVITSDHGEELQDHGLLNHTQLYREVMRVPLMVLHPERRTPVRHGGVVQLIDLAPTLYQLARLQPAGRPSGTSLGRLLGNPAPSDPGDAWMEGPPGRALYRGHHRDLRSLLLLDQPQRVELYEVSADPAQHHDRSGTDRGSVRDLLAALKGHEPAPLAAPSSPPLEPELAERLRALGYLQ